MDETVEQRCVQLFREIVGLQNPGLVSSWDDSRLLAEPLEAIDIDSLSRLEFIMRVESTYGVELDEAEVNACRTIGELATLVADAAK
jgi:acyl carrier protein